MKKIIFGGLAVCELVAIFATQGAFEQGLMPPREFIMSFAIQIIAFVLCAGQAGAFDMPEEKEKP